MKSLDMADKYPPAEDFDDEDTTVRMHVPTFLPKVIVEDEGEDEYDLWGARDTIPCPPPYPHPHMKREVNWGAVGILAFTIVFWWTVGYMLYCWIY